jgi:hypothetical protein
MINGLLARNDSVSMLGGDGNAAADPAGLSQSFNNRAPFPRFALLSPVQPLYPPT